MFSFRKKVALLLCFVLIIFFCIITFVADKHEVVAENTDHDTSIQQQVVQRGFTNSTIINALQDTPRKPFLPASLQSKAYKDRSIPIAKGITLTSLYQTATILKITDPQAHDTIFITPSNTGYLCSLLAPHVQHIDTLANSKEQNRLPIQFNNITSHTSFPLHKSYSKIIIHQPTESSINPDIFSQLQPNGKLLQVIGYDYQSSIKVYSSTNNKIIYHGEEPLSYQPSH